MKNYYTVLDLQNGLFVGTVFNSLTNQEIYKTNLYKNQALVTKEINNFLIKKHTDDPVSEQQGINNIVKTGTTIPVSVQPQPTITRRCCGR